MPLNYRLVEAVVRGWLATDLLDPALPMADSVLERFQPLVHAMILLCELGFGYGQKYWDTFKADQDLAAAEAAGAEEEDAEEAAGGGGGNDSGGSEDNFPPGQGGPRSQETGSDIAEAATQIIATQILCTGSTPPQGSGGGNESGSSDDSIQAGQGGPRSPDSTAGSLGSGEEQEEEAVLDRTEPTPEPQLGRNNTYESYSVRWLKNAQPSLADPKRTDKTDRAACTTSLLVGNMVLPSHQ